MTDMADRSMTEHGPVDVPDPSLIMQVGMGFWPSKTLLTAVELGLFTALGTGACTADELADRLDLRSRAVADFLDGLVALRLLERDGSGSGCVVPEHHRDRSVPRRNEPAVHRRLPGDEQRPAVRLLGKPD